MHLPANHNPPTLQTSGSSSFDTPLHNKPRLIPNMSPSITRIRINAVLAALKATFKHYTSRDYPPDWDLRFHIQFAILKNLLAHTGGWTVEEVSPPPST